MYSDYIRLLDLHHSVKHKIISRLYLMDLYWLDWVTNCWHCSTPSAAVASIKLNKTASSESSLNALIIYCTIDLSDRNTEWIAQVIQFFNKLSIHINHFHYKLTSLCLSTMAAQWWGWCVIHSFTEHEFYYLLWSPLFIAHYRFN